MLQVIVTNCDSLSTKLSISPFFIILSVPIFGCVVCFCFRGVFFSRRVTRVAAVREIFGRVRRAATHMCRVY